MLDCVATQAKLMGNGTLGESLSVQRLHLSMSRVRRLFRLISFLRSAEIKFERSATGSACG